VTAWLSRNLGSLAHSVLQVAFGGLVSETFIPSAVAGMWWRELEIEQWGEKRWMEDYRVASALECNYARCKARHLPCEQQQHTWCSHGSRQWIGWAGRIMAMGMISVVPMVVIYCGCGRGSQRNQPEHDNSAGGAKFDLRDIRTKCKKSIRARGIRKV
jgi:hypothetical protein